MANEIAKRSTKNRTVSTFWLAFDGLFDNLVNDSVSYCTCVVENFSDDRPLVGR